MDSKHYNNLKLAVSIIKATASFILILLFVVSGLSRILVVLLNRYSSNPYIQFLLFIGIIGIVSGMLFFPLNYYTGFYLEHKYNLSNQDLLGWMWEDLKGLLLSLVIGIPVLLLFFYALNKYGANWWIHIAILLFVLSILLARIVPIFILPLFYKITPLEDEDHDSGDEK